MSDAPPKRRLPVLQSAPPPDERPAWHAIVTTALAMLFAWILLAWVANASLGARVRSGEADLVVTIVNLVAFALSGAGAGALTARTSPASTRKHAAWGGVVTAALGWSVPFAWTLVAGAHAGVVLAWLALLSAMVTVAVGATSLGFRLARRVRG